MKQEAVLIERKNVVDTLRINPSEFVPLPELFEDICKLKTILPYLLYHHT